MMDARSALPVIDTTRCTGCGRCVAACNLHLLSLEPQGWKKFSTLHDADRCTGCGECEVQCPFNAIAMHESAMV
jgi:NAD-dependent dihydropyrimidine dehydrogenase PreA subunit